MVRRRSRYWSVWGDVPVAKLLSGDWGGESWDMAIERVMERVRARDISWKGRSGSWLWGSFRGPGGSNGRLGMVGEVTR
jgi:hypothetical protein